MHKLLDMIFIDVNIMKFQNFFFSILHISVWQLDYIELYKSWYFIKVILIHHFIKATVIIIDHIDCFHYLNSDLTSKRHIIQLLLKMFRCLGVPHKTRHRIIIWPTNPTFGSYAKELKQVLNSLFMNIHSCIIHSSQKMEATQMSINWIDKQKCDVYI